VEVSGVALEGGVPLELADRVAACGGTLTATLPL
jgi:hypothetical protein